ncbi:MAG: PAS domain-containing protein [Betaproteobacteria bacterium]
MEVLWHVLKLVSADQIARAPKLRLIRKIGSHHRLIAAAEMLLDRVAQGVLTVSWDGKVTYANGRIAAMAGVQRPSLLAAPFSELVPPAERERLGVALGAGRESLTHQRFSLLRADASELPVLMTFAPLAHGQASCLVTDLTEQRRREESAARLSRSRTSPRARRSPRRCRSASPASSASASSSRRAPGLSARADSRSPAALEQSLPFAIGR